MDKEGKCRSTQKYLFVLSPPYCGSTLLWKILGTSPAVSSLPREGQSVDGAAHVMPGSVLLQNPEYEVPWRFVKEKWKQKWDLDQQILLEKSPSNIHRAFEIQDHFSPSSFVALMRNPYAFCEGYSRRKQPRTCEGGARLWVRCARSQRNNVENLERVIQVRYEDLTEDTEAILRRIESFMPKLRELKPNEDTTKTLLGRQSDIRNINETKIKRLTPYQIRQINKILDGSKDLLSFFGYHIRDAATYSTFGAWLHRAKSISIRGLRWIRRKKLVPNYTKNSLAEK